MDLLGVPVVLLNVIAAALAVVRLLFMEWLAGLNTLFALCQSWPLQLSLSTSLECAC